MTIVVVAGVVVFVAAVLASALPGASFGRLAAFGAVLGLALWVAAGIVIYRGPDNPELGERGWTVGVGILLGACYVAWVLGAAAGSALRRRRPDGVSSV